MKVRKMTLSLPNLSNYPNGPMFPSFGFEVVSKSMFRNSYFEVNASKLAFKSLFWTYCILSVTWIFVKIKPNDSNNGSKNVLTINPQILLMKVVLNIFLIFLPNFGPVLRPPDQSQVGLGGRTSTWSDLELVLRVGFWLTQIMNPLIHGEIHQIEQKARRAK